jgi:hypothetical protein
MTVDAALSRVSPLHRGDPTRLGPYRLAGRLGSGGMGVVYLATEPDGGYVAVKLVHAELAEDPEFRARFRSEVERARQVPSFSTAEVLDADLDHNPPYLVVEYVDGPSLAEVVDERGPLTAANLHTVAVGVATALVGIHGAGVIHRDLKPENVLLAPGSPKVIDFGIARAFEAYTQYTRTDQMVGTVAYMAPERISSEPSRPPSAAADVFAWGCVVAYAGTGRTPFHGDSPAATAAKILTQPPHLGTLAPPLRGLVELALAKDPDDRPTARELLDLLVDSPPPRLEPERARDGWPVYPVDAVYPGEASYPAGSFRRRRPVPDSTRWLALLAALLVIAGIATVVTVVRASGRPGSDPAAGTPVTPRKPVRGAPTPAADNRTAGPRSPGSPAGQAIQDPLSRPGQWQSSEIRTENARCLVRNVLRATRVDQGTFQCSGPQQTIDDSFGVGVTTSLETQGSCAAVWFHWADVAGGQVLRICQAGFALALDRPDDQRVLGTLALDRPIPLGRAVRVRFTVAGGALEVFLSGVRIGRLALPPDSPDTGQVRLGISVSAVAAPPPYAVTFADVDISTL